MPNYVLDMINRINKIYRLFNMIIFYPLPFSLGYPSIMLYLVGIAYYIEIVLVH